MDITTVAPAVAVFLGMASCYGIGHLNGRRGLRVIEAAHNELAWEVAELRSRNRQMARDLADLGARNFEMKSKLDRYADQRRAAGERGRMRQAAKRDSAKVNTIEAAAMAGLRPRDEVVSGVAEARKARLANR